MSICGWGWGMSKYGKVNLRDSWVWSLIKNSFDLHLRTLCRKVNQKVSALARIVPILPFPKRHLIMKTFIESQFSYCPLIWMFCSNTMNNKINHIHERALRLVYQDYSSTFEELLTKDKSLCFHHRNIQQVAIEMYKVKHDVILKNISHKVANLLLLWPLHHDQNDHI